MKFIETFTRNKKGQGLIEYAFIIGLIAIVAIVALTASGSSISNLWVDKSESLAIETVDKNTTDTGN